MSVHQIVHVDVGIQHIHKDPDKHHDRIDLPNGSL